MKEIIQGMFFCGLIWVLVTLFYSFDNLPESFESENNFTEPTGAGHVH